MRPLETAHLLLREFRSDDIADIARWEAAAKDESENRATAQEFLDFCFREYRVRALGPWAIVLKKTESVVGNCGFPHVDFRRSTAEINFYIAPKYRRQGLASEAIKGLFKLGFDHIGLARIQGRCMLDNVASERLMLGAGMTFERIIQSTATSERPRQVAELFAITR